MTRLFNDPAHFATEMIEGFAAASAAWVHAVPGGVVRSTRGERPTVALVTGGGSGHYPAFGGLVGPGLAHGAAMGNVFASPSAHQVQSVATAAHEGRGVLLAFGNYAGDVLHFGQARDRLLEAGIDCRVVTVTDDISSAPKDEASRRRGIAGSLAIYKTAGAAAEAGYDLDGVERVARVANERTRSLGVAFGGCTLPGADGPLFEVPDGRMAVGLGIHGEPGIDETDVPTADELAHRLIDALLAEVPEGVSSSGARVVPILNGLGAVKYEELFVLYRSIHRLLDDAGVVVVAPEVGEYCTSFDMAGVSLSLLWLDEELESLWLAPCDTPTFRRGVVAGRVERAAEEVAATDAVAALPSASDGSRAVAPVVVRALELTAAVIAREADELGRIDRIAGDGDHGIGMERGSRAAADAAAAASDRGAGAGTTLALAGEAWSDAGGGTSGAIWGEMLHALGSAIGDEADVDAAALARGVAAMKDAVMSFGKAKPGDKTMIDAIVPFADELIARVDAGDGIGAAWMRASEAAGAAADETANMVAKLGRARSHGERSLGTPDPGAVSFALIVATVSEVVARC